jgi:hypothetical protein
MLRRGTPLLSATTGPALPKLSNRFQLADNLRLESYLREAAMKLPRHTFLRLAVGAAALPAVSRIVWGQAYPACPVRIIVGFAPGGATDIMARLIGQWLSDRLGQQFVVENRPGAASNVGTEAVVNAAPDGYTLLVVTPASIKRICP